MRAWYGEEILSASFEELKALVDWINKNHGYHPTIIGGWAVYSYIPSLGSRDIDIIFPTRESVGKVLMPFYSARCYQSSGLFSKRYYREIETPSGKESIYLDASSLADRNYLHEDNEIEIPWSLAFEFNQDWILDKFVARVPKVEILLIYKVKALADRRSDLGKPDTTLLDQAYIRSKIWKDEHDIKLLSQQDINIEFLKSKLDDLGFEEHFKRELERMRIRL